MMPLATLTISHHDLYDLCVTVGLVVSGLGLFGCVCYIAYRNTGPRR